MRAKKIEMALAVMVVGVGLVITAVFGLFVYMSNTATPLHPDAGAVPSATASPAPDTSAGAIAEAREAALKALVAQNLPGLSVAVAVDGDVVWAEGLGWADLDAKVPVTPDTRFGIGTASTALTSAGVGLLVERGLLGLDDPIQTYVPEFPQKPWPVTVRQLMAHVAGVRNDGGDEGPLLSAHCARPVDALEHFGERDLLFEPGTDHHYSSYGWILVSAALEAASRGSFDTFMRTQVFEPLGMDATAADGDRRPPGPRATQYFPRFAADPRYGLHLMREVDYSCYSGASVFVSTASDLVRFGAALERGTLLQRATVDMLRAPQPLTSGRDTGAGLGWEHETVTLHDVPTRTVGQDGTLLGGRVASLLVVPDHGTIVAVVSNIAYADTFAIATAVAEAFATRGPRS